MTKLNFRGASLVELLVTVGLLGIAATGTLTVMQVVHRSTAASKQNAAASDVLNRINSFLTNRAMCSQIFNGYTLNLDPATLGALPADIDPPATIDSLSFAGDDMLVRGQSVNGVRTERMEFTRVIEVLPKSNGNPRFILEFEVELARVEGGALGTRSFWIAGTQPAAGGTLLSCSSVGEVEQTVMCESVGATPPADGCAIYPTYEYY